MRGASTRRVVITIGEAPGGEEACDTSSSSDGEGSSDEDEGSDDNALNRPIEQEAVAGLRYKIVIEASRGPVRWFEVPAASFTVGRAKDNQVCLSGDDFAHVSRTHIKVEYRAGRLWVCDMNSSKGTLMESAGAGTGKGALVALTAGKSYTLPEGRKVTLGGCVDLVFQVERSQDVASKKEQRRKERTESGGGRAQFVSDLQSAVFRRKITEVGTVATMARQRRERGPRHVRNDEFGRRVTHAASRSRSRSRSRSAGRDHGGRNAGRSVSRSPAKRSRSRSAERRGRGGDGRDRAGRGGRSRSRSRSRSTGRDRDGRRSRSASRGRESRREWERESRGAGRERVGRGRAKEGVDADRWEHRPLSLSPSPPRN